MWSENTIFAHCTVSAIFFPGLDWTTHALLAWLMDSILMLAVSMKGKTTLGLFAYRLVVKGSSLSLWLHLWFWSSSSLLPPSSSPSARFSKPLPFSPSVLPPLVFLSSSFFLQTAPPGCFHILSFLVLSNQMEAKGAVCAESPQSSRVQYSNCIFQTFVSALSEIIWGSW